MTKRALKSLLIAAALFSVSALSVRAVAESAWSGRVIVGTVIAVRPPLVTVRLPNLLGYLRMRVRTYKVRQPASLNGLRPGNRITGVLSQSDGLLHRVRRIAEIQDLERPL